MRLDIGYFPRLGLHPNSISEFSLKEKGLDSKLSPNTRPFFLTGFYNGQEIVIKPYERRAERQVIPILFGSDISLLLDYGNFGFIERVESRNPLEIEYRKDLISTQKLGKSVGEFLGDLHLMGLGYDHHLSEHLFDSNGTIKGTDFGATGFNPDQRINDIVEGLEYIRETAKHKGIKEISAGVESFHQSYSKKSDPRYFDLGVARHLKYSQREDPLRRVLG